MSASQRKELAEHIIRISQPDTDDLDAWTRSVCDRLSVRDLEVHQRYLSSALDDAMEQTLNTTTEIGTVEHELELSKTAEISNHLAGVEVALALHA